MSVNVTEYESTLWHDGLRIRILSISEVKIIILPGADAICIVSWFPIMTNICAH